MLGAAAAAWILVSGVPIALVALLSLATFWWHYRGLIAGLRPFGGYANCLTVFRLALVLAAAAFLTRLPAGGAAAIFAANVALDVADGHAARRMQQTSRFGAALDRESDAVFVLVAYTYFFLRADVGAWILLPGMLPYAYRLAAAACTESQADGGRERHAVLLAGVNYGLLLAATIVSGNARVAVLIISTGIVACSFLASFHRLHRHVYSSP
ncbi:MAG TPA: CDP-alcohol phosphatidyltransferase family protein [Gammaproteobacteria bacterium]|nr:CDP-alcohol phosphatidyltransferase family protein [Gammaproteobacteria bacterium]